MRRLRSRRGASAITIALSLLSLLGAGAIVVDLGCQRLFGHQLQSGLDAAALAGAQYLSSGPTNARLAAATIAGRNPGRLHHHPDGRRDRARHMGRHVRDLH